MKISEVINNIKDFCYGYTDSGKKIGENTRDKILYGGTDVECTGIVVSCWASSDMIRKTAEKGANLLIVTESMFWNHGDHTDWLEDNKVFIEKKKLLDEHNITVWRFHEYLIGGAPLNGFGYVDGIVYGFMKEMGWESYATGGPKDTPIYKRYTRYEIPSLTAEQISEELVHKLHLNGTRIAGDKNTVVKKLAVIPEILGYFDNEILEQIEKEDIDCAIVTELTDYTLCEYFRDSSMLGRPRALINLGNFNRAEAGMTYTSRWIPQVVYNAVPVYNFISGDPFVYKTRV